MAALGPAQPIRFTVRKSSPCVPGFPASELEVQSVNSKGYLTSSSSAAAAELVLELVGGGRFDLAELQILAHESCIPARIDVAVQLLSSDSPGFQTLGYMAFEDNSRSGYLARELQSVRIACSNCTHVRLVFHAPHPTSTTSTSVNPDRHVGIIGMNILGWKRQHEPVLQQQPASSAAEHSSPVIALLARVGELKRAKESAVAREAYDEALQLKNEELELSRLAELAQDLEQSKLEAAVREDYEEAQRIKNKLDDLLHPRKRGSAAAASSPLPHLPPGTPTSPSHHHQRNTSGSSAKALLERKSPGFRSASPPVPAIAANKPKPQQQPSSSSSSADAAAAPVGFWNQGNEQALVAEGLEPSLRASEDVRAMTAAFGGPYFARCLYSAHVELRGAVLAKLVAQLSDQAASDDVHDVDLAVAALLACGVGLGEPGTPSVFTRALRVAELVLDRLGSTSSPPSPRVQVCFDTVVLPRLVDALVSSTTTSSATATDTAAASALFIRISHQVFDSAHAVRLITAPPAAAGKRSSSSTLFRPLLARLHLLHLLLKETTDSVGGGDMMHVLEWCKTNGLFQHAQEKVQHACMELCVLLYSSSSPGKQREDVKRFLLQGGAALRPQQLQQYTAALAAAASSTTSTTTRASPSPPAASSSSCVFCGKTGLLREDDLDLHMWKDCAMLSACPHCSQVIEIAKLNDHLLQECDLRGNHRACPRCHEAIAIALWDKHVKRNACLPAKSHRDANRCPLCHNDVYPGESGWRIHLMRDLCPNNSRTSELLILTGGED